MEIKPWQHLLFNREAVLTRRSPACPCGSSGCLARKTGGWEFTSLRYPRSVPWLVRTNEGCPAKPGNASRIAYFMLFLNPLFLLSNSTSDCAVFFVIKYLYLHISRQNRNNFPQKPPSFCKRSEKRNQGLFFYADLVISMPIRLVRIFKFYRIRGVWPDHRMGIQIPKGLLDVGRRLSHQEKGA